MDIKEIQEYKVTVYEDRTEWYQNGKCHRLDGPAIEWTNGVKSWWIDGKEYTEQEFAERAEYERLKAKFGVEE